MKIKKGDRFLCIKDVAMDGGGVTYRKGNTYLSELNGCITDDDYDIHHNWKGIKYFNEHFEKILSEEVRSEADNIKTHIDKGGRYIIISDDAKFQVGDLWIDSVVYSCVDSGMVFCREKSNFYKSFKNT